MDELARRRKWRKAEQAEDARMSHPLATIVDDLGVAHGFIVEAEACAREEGAPAIEHVLTAAKLAVASAQAMVREELAK
jgi:hypothetical protein